MPLHLLGKKSWNVYNTANIERVRRDEAAARAREEAEEERQQEVDAARRLAILRGETPPPLPSPAEQQPGDETPAGGRKRAHEGERRGPDAAFPSGRKKRKRAGEDDTDFELRLAREKVQTARPQDVNNNPNKNSGKGSSDAPLTDSAGHIDLFPEEREAAALGSKHGHGRGQKNEEAEREAARKRREYEDQYTMRFSNAAGRDGTVAADGPWYAQKQQQRDENNNNNDDDDARMAMVAMPSKDVWGNEDPRRREREVARVVASDPLAMMRRGAAKVREVETERRKADEERERELKQLRREERRREKEGKRRREGGGRGPEDDELEGFSLDDPGLGRSERKHRRRDMDHGEDSEHRKHNRHRHRRSREDDGGHRHSPEHRHRHESSRSRSRRDYEEDERRSRGHDHRRAAKKDRY
ncbi:hypothetical protein DL771_002043 [Monosporascus sp. 5C6A]|nr:hypothetical protein DL771_002043 [Monosporascus sp. 5C6A]